MKLSSLQSTPIDAWSKGCEPSGHSSRDCLAVMNFRDVLLIENQALVALDLADDMAGWGFSVIGIAAEASTAMELADRLRLHLIISDAGSDRDFDGVEIVRAIKAKFHPEVVFLTAHSDFETKSRILSVNPAGYLYKPYSPRPLHDLLSQIAATYR